MNDVLWSSSPSASCLHAALCRAEGLPAADPEFAACIDPQADALIAEITLAGWPILAALAQLAPLARESRSQRAALHARSLIDSAAGSGLLLK